ncbi:LuxR C-terminal-related transcriptional regulator [Bradyrhizobium sp. STM 3557]|uniref:LuxR C-terminal-related transcriptional regulator n=1 Tax=Bradyrhizobium sp. STM 3557 TaxID=578920 RepID=UPI00388D93E5
MRRRSISTILVGRNSLLSEGLAKILRSANFRILASVASADDLLAGKAPPPQSLFLLVHTGDNFEAAVAQVQLVRSRHPDGNIGVVTDRYRLDELALAFRAGANGYFVDVMTCDAFVKSLELMMMGHAIFPPAFLSFVLDFESDDQLDETASDGDGNEPDLIAANDSNSPELSPREKTILRCLIEGDSNKSIGRKMNIAEATVKVHIKAILRKIRVHNRTQAAIWWINQEALTQQAGNKAPEESKPASASRGETPEMKQIAIREHVGAINHKSVSHLGTEGTIRFRKQPAS